MKRKILTILFSVMAMLACTIVCVACGDKIDSGNGSNSGGGDDGNKPIVNATVSGTYYYYENCEYDAAMFIKFGSTKWSDDEALNGDYKISGNDIALYIGNGDDNTVYLNGIVNNDEITFKVLGEDYVYKKNADLDILPAQKSLNYKLSEDKNFYTVIGLGGLSGDIVVPDTYKKKPVVEIAENAFANKANLTSIELSDTLISIGASAFEECVNLTNIEIPSSVTQLGEKAFNKCENLKSVKIDGNIEEIKEKTFADCGKLEEIALPSTLKSIGSRAFINCLSLTDVCYSGNIKDWCSIDFGMVDKSELGWANPLSSNKDGDKEYANRSLIIGGKTVTDIEISYPVSAGAFIFYMGLQSVKIGSGMPCVEDYTFCGCENIETLTIANNSVSIIGIDAFQNTKELKTLVIPDCVIEIGGDAFSGSGVQSVVIGNGVTSIEVRAFLWCENLTSLTIGNSVVEIGEYAFSQCGLTKVTIPQSVMYIGAYTFQGTPLTAVVFERTESWITGGKDNITGGQGEIPSNDMANPTRIAQYLTKSTTNGGLMSVHIEVSPLIYKLQSDNTYAVKGIAEKLYRRNVIIPPVHNGLPVYAIADYAFDNSAITAIEIPNSITFIGNGAFRSCYNLTSVKIPVSVTNIRDMCDPFAYCWRITVYCEAKQGAYNIGAFWYNTTSAHRFYYPVIWDCNNNNKDNTYDCEFAIIEGIRYMLLTDNRAFVDSQPSSIIGEKVTIPSSVTYNGEIYKVTHIYAKAFFGCDKLKEIVIPKTVTSIITRVVQGFPVDYIHITVYYAGSADEWNSIEGSWLFADAPYYYSEMCPSESGNYWHYDDNGEIVIW